MLPNNSKEMENSQRSLRPSENGTVTVAIGFVIGPIFLGAGWLGAITMRIPLQQITLIPITKTNTRTKMIYFSSIKTEEICKSTKNIQINYIFADSVKT